jgi:iron complex outermembrane recepter protein
MHRVAIASPRQESGQSHYVMKTSSENNSRRCSSFGRLPTRALGSFLAVALALVSLHASDVAGNSTKKNIADLSIEELMNESITSVSKKETTLLRSAAAIAVVTHEDVRRLGITTLPEALRIVPGLDVARVNANKWAISSRGFNGQFANKLLVLIDGRAVYTPAFAGVYWDVQDVALDDLERIEVIRGPGSTLWGANAVNGVINILTKSARDTQGTLVSVAAGTEDQPSATVRHGGKLAPNVYYRGYIKYFNRQGFVDPAGNRTPDDWNMLRGGFRIDGDASLDSAFTVQGDYYTGEFGEHKQRASLTPPFSQPFDAVGRDRGGNVVGRWTRTFSGQSQLTLQTYYDRFEENRGAGLNQETRDTVDVDVQHRFGWANRHDIVWGLGYRYTRDRLPSNFGLTWIPESRRDQLFSAFLQDEITLPTDKWHLTLGSKIEHNDFTGWEVQPSARLLWTPAEWQTIWASVSRSVRTPSRFERGMRLNAAAFQPSPFSPVFLVSLFGNPKIVSEKLAAYELGYRIESSKRRIALDVAAYYHVYDDLLTFVAEPSRFETSPSPPHQLVTPSTFQNRDAAETYGTEISIQWRATEQWKFVAGYTWLQMRMRVDKSVEGNSPQQQFHLRSYLDLPRELQVTAAAFYVDRLPTPNVPAYLRFDLGLTWRATKALELGVWGQNLLDEQHLEATTNSSSLRTEVPRSLMARATWRF